MDQQETKLTTVVEKDLHEPITPFFNAYVDQEGTTVSRNISLSRFGPLAFYASNDLGEVDARKFFKYPKRIWVELSIADKTPQDEVDAIASMLSVNIDIRGNKTVTMTGHAQGTKIIFDNVTTSQEPPIKNPLIEDRSQLPKMVFEFSDVPDFQPFPN